MLHPLHVLLVGSPGSPALPPLSGDFAIECGAGGGRRLSRPATPLADVVVLAAGAGGEEDWALFEQARQTAPTAPLVLIAPESASDFVFRACRAGADAFVPAPVDARRLAETLLAVHRDRTLAAPAADASVPEPPLLLGNSEAIRGVRRLLGQVADTDVTVLLSGESGTGKELAARFLCRRSARSAHPLVKVNCAAIPHDLLESELFGYEAGAFTGALRQKPGKFELAHQGTIFLDEVGELHPLLQAKLLHILQDGEFCRLGGKQSLTADVRIIAATNDDLEASVARGRFRRDLYYRLNVVSLTLPPLRARPEDIPLLLDAFLTRFARTCRRPLRRFSAAAMERLLRYSWPGNVRELESVAKRLLVLGDEHQILLGLESSRSRLAAFDTAPVAALPAPASAVWSPDSRRTLLEIGREAAQKAETEAILRALQQTQWNRRQAARLLRVSYKALQNKLKTMKSICEPLDALGEVASLRPQ